MGVGCGERCHNFSRVTTSCRANVPPSVSVALAVCILFFCVCFCLWRVLVTICRFLSLFSLIRERCHSFSTLCRSNINHLVSVSLLFVNFCVFVCKCLCLCVCLCHNFSRVTTSCRANVPPSVSVSLMFVFYLSACASVFAVSLSQFLVFFLFSHGSESVATASQHCAAQISILRCMCLCCS